MPQAVQEKPMYKILVVEDNPNDRFLYERLLNKSEVPFKIFEAANVNDGLEISRTQEVDCILLDYRLPDSNGIDFIKACQKEGLESNAAIVMITGQGNEQTAVEAMKLGALDYIAKNSIIENFFVQSILNAIERANLKRQIIEYQEELERSYVALSDFSHTASHDLKAPLRRITQYCQLLKEDAGNSLTPESLEYTERLIIITGRMQRLIDDLLAYSKTLNERESKVQTDIGYIVMEALDELDISIKETEASITVDELPTLSVYPLRMKELFQNLIANALKYKSNPPPEIKISYMEDPQNYTFSISDNGEGIDSEYHETIFKAFERLHTQDEIEGSGLGLSICRKVVEMHGGTIWVESVPGSGSTFKFTLPKR